MRLYLTAGGVYVGTQNDARKEGKGWREEIVPTDKSGLIEYLNTLAYKGSPTPMLESVAPSETAIAIDTSDIPETKEAWFKEATLTQPTAEAIAKKVAQFKADEIIEFILDHASVDQCASILSSIGTRFAEHIKEARNA